MEEMLPEKLQLLVSSAQVPDAAQALFCEALTHRTYVNEQQRKRQHNQRLELLGDAVLELIVTDYFFQAMPHADEGLLTRVRARIVNEASLADAARRLSLSEFLRLGRGEVATGGRERPGILADAFEAVIAAAYLACGLSAAQELVLYALHESMQQEVTAAAPLKDSGIDTRAKDPKSLLQELVQQGGNPVPVYVHEQAVGPSHARVFCVNVHINGTPSGQGQGRSRREAEMRAAEDALERLNAPSKESSNDHSS